MTLHTFPPEHIGSQNEHCTTSYNRGSTPHTMHTPPHIAPTTT